VGEEEVMNLTKMISSNARHARAIWGELSKPLAACWKMQFFCNF